MTAKWKPGDVVHIKSGNGPIMVVAGDDEIGHIMCEWFDEKRQHQKSTFSPDVLEKHEPPVNFDRKIDYPKSGL